MMYRELLERCRINPGWLGSREQKATDSALKYRAWMERMNKEYGKEKGKDKHK